ncbi:response regulator receiver protein [Mycolicibacterium phlei]|jgi:DNA-binding NarL/FixJ family response regulator|uniref:Chemotaxis protein CheY n=1 Tax=Mycolicibacterium phlei DSM 43239 = CCUG 21000 TaxID=1226750 RepID=A0A5N5UTA9_MYCPH|nr:response regulator transcription factor [Mycolicibacterium phlei]VEG08907.1 response regulator receiver protein [Mycobacteroides chelonae]AMO60789.1 Putative transcriptional regulator [Mycolicibacterium phlei]EID12399.1 response regulator receiver protein [Mycolicibacterium phlei RIVM601174]KAB7751340.1 chemotaxis protein CheY [Mycolicibacterium phlei DSM 43239 = CCUG 21000]KXW67981.1 chemotaxis protein CheY [Mycolicibacterium phlei DSM 43239 = CCUG 21000]
MRCLIVDDSAGFRAAATAMLERGGICVVGTASDGAEALSQTRALHPDVALVDVDLGAESGFDVAADLARQTAGTAIILVSTHDEQDFADLIAASPARGFLPKMALSPNAIRDLLGSA